MTSKSQNESSSTAATQATEPKPLPQGYLWRLAVVVCLLMGGAVCLIFFNGVVGSLLSLAGLAFGKLSGLNNMVASAAEKTHE